MATPYTTRHQGWPSVVRDGEPSVAINALDHSAIRTGSQSVAAKKDCANQNITDNSLQIFLVKLFLIPELFSKIP